MLRSFLSTLIMVPVLVSATDRVGDFSLLDQDGYHHGMSWYDDHQAIVFLVQSNDSESASVAVPGFNDLKSKYEEAGVEFMMINPMGRLNREEVQERVKEYGVDIPVLMDDARVISETLGIERVGEVLIFDPKRFSVEFRGTVPSAELALKQLLENKEISPRVVETNGMIVSYPQKETPSYVADIAPVLAEQCASCHREGGVAPFAMDSHTMVKGWSPMIREVLMTRRMPPGQIDGHIGEFINDRLVDDKDVRNIIAWVEAGAPKDGDLDPLANLEWPESKWAFGEPDTVSYTHLTLPTTPYV